MLTAWTSRLLASWRTCPRTSVRSVHAWTSSNGTVSPRSRQRLDAARQIETEAAEADDTVSLMRARLVAGDMLQRLGRVAEGAKAVVDVARVGDGERSAVAPGPHATS